MAGDHDSFALITARGGSKGLPRKNLREVGGSTLIDRAIDSARRCPDVGRVVVSTDDAEIMSVAGRWDDVELVERPPGLATDIATHEDVLIDVVRRLSQDRPLPAFLVLLQPTSPLRLPDDISGALEIARSGAISVASVSPARDHPYLARRIDVGGRLVPFVDHVMQDPRRQALPPAFVLNGAIYVFRTQQLLEDGRLPADAPMAFEMPPERGIDIDSEMDLVVAEAVLRSGVADG